MSGICIDSLNAAGVPSVEELRSAGADGVRDVARDDPRFFAYAQTILDAGLKLAVVIARESCANDDFGGWSSYYSGLLVPTYWVLGNEADAGLLDAESPSSWKMTIPEYAAFWHACATAILANQPEAKCLSAGMVSGQPSWAAEVAPLLDPPAWGWTVHPYGRDAESARELLHLYQEAIG